MLLDMINNLAVLLCLAVGAFIWYSYYGFEMSYFNGYETNFVKRFVQLWREFTWLFPGGQARKLAFVGGDEEKAKFLPGIWHFVIVHVLLPLSPLAIWYVL